MTGNERIRLDLILNRSCVAVVIDESMLPLGIPRNLFQHPALMFAFKGSGAIICVRWGGRCRLWGAHGRRQDPKTPVQQALMRGLVTA